MRLAARQTILYSLLSAGGLSLVAAFFFLSRMASQPSRAEASCAPLLGCFGFFGLGMMMMILVLLLIPWAARATWEGEAAGRRLRVTNRALHEALYVDDQLVTEHRGFSFGTTLRSALLQADGPPLPIEATVGGLVTIKCRCRVAGQEIAMREVP